MMMIFGEPNKYFYVSVFINQSFIGGGGKIVFLFIIFNPPPIDVGGNGDGGGGVRGGNQF